MNCALLWPRAEGRPPPSVERFDPVALRCEVLRRVAREASRRPNDTSLFGGQISQPTPATPVPSTNPAASPGLAQRPTAVGVSLAAAPASVQSLGSSPASAQSHASPAAATPSVAVGTRETEGRASQNSASGPEAEAATGAQNHSSNSSENSATTTAADANAVGAGKSVAASVASVQHDGKSTCQAGTHVPPHPSCNAENGQQDSSPSQPFCYKDELKRRIGTARESVRKQIETWVREAKLGIFLVFPPDSIFNDANVEELYQNHHMHQWSPRLEWSSVALFQMLLWDLVSSQRYRMPLVLHFYIAFVAMVFLHTTLFVAMRADPQWWRISRGALLCGFLVGRGLVCHPFLSGPLPETEAEKTAFGVHATTSLIGIGMTNLSGFLALQLHTLDTLLLCIAHGTTWLWVMLSLPSGASPGDVEGWHMLLAGHLVVSFVCVWQQREQERFERSHFEEELLMERSMLLRSSDCLVRRGTQDDFRTCMHLLHRARLREHLNF